VSTTEEGGQKEGVGVAIGRPRVCLAVEGDGSVGLCANCDHEVSEEAGVGDGGQQI
jgi:hypothetical protein